MAANDNRLLLEFGAIIDSSVKSAFGQVGNAVQKLTAQIALLADDIRELNNENTQTVTATKKLHVAARDFTTQIVKQTTAIAKGKAVSQEYLRIQHDIEQQYGANSIAAGTALRALEKTERQYRRNAEAINRQKIALTQLLANQKELAISYHSAPDFDAKLTSYKELQENKARIASARMVLQQSTESIASSFNYSRTYADNLQKIERTLKVVTLATKQFGQEQQWVSELAQQITARTGEGTLEQRRQFNMLRQYVREAGMEYQTLESRIRSAEKTITSASESERVSIQRVIDELREKQQALTSGLSVKGIHGFDQWATGIKKVEAQFATLRTAFRSIEQTANHTMESVRNGILSAAEAQKRLKALTSLSTAANTTQTQFGLTPDAMDTVLRSTEAIAKVTSGRVTTQREINRLLAGEARKLQNIIPLHQRIADEIGSTVRVLAQYAISGTAIYGVAAAFRAGAASVVEYDQAMKDLQAITGATDTDLAALGEEIRRVAVETRYGMTEVADGAKVIGQAGYSASDTIEVLSSTMELAQGTMSSVEASADLLTTTLMSFRKNASEAAGVADIMAAAMNKSKLDVEKLRTVFNYVGPVAIDAGLSLQEVTSALMLLANNGMKASTIGTSLRNIFSQLSSPSEKLRTAFKGNEKALDELTSKTTPLVDRFRILNEQLGTNADLYQLFGLRAAGAVSIMRSMYPELQRLKDSLYVMGTASIMAEKQMEGLGNRLANLRAAFEVFLVSSTTTVTSIFSELVLGLQKAVIFLSEFADGALGNAITTTLALTTALMGLITVLKVLGVWLKWIGASAVLGGVAKGLKSVAMGTAGLAMGFASGGAAASKFGGALHGLAGVLAWFSAHPAIAVIAGITAAVAGIAVAIKAMTNETEAADVAVNRTIRTLNKQRDLLTRGLEANQNIEDPTTRQTNTLLIASQFPGMAPALVESLNDQQKTAAIMERGITDITQQLLDTTTKQYENLETRIQKKETELTRVITQTREREAQRRQPRNVSSLLGFSSVDLPIGDLTGLTREIADARTQQSQQFSRLVEIAKIRTDAVMKAVPDSNRVAVFTEKLNELTAALPASANGLRDLALMMYAVEHNEVNLIAATEGLSDFLQRDGKKSIEDQAKAYGVLSDVVYPRLLKAAQQYYNNVTSAEAKFEAGTEDAVNAKIAAEAEYARELRRIMQDSLKDQTAITNLATNAKRLAIEKEVADGVKTREEANAELQAIEEEGYKQSIQNIQNVLQYLYDLNKEKIDTKKLPIEAVLQGDLSPEQWQMLLAAMSNEQAQLFLASAQGLQEEQTKLLRYQANRTRNENGANRAAQNHLKAIKAQLAAEDAIAERAYKFGEISYDEYTNKRIASERRLLIERRKVAQSMTGADRKKALQEIIRDEAKLDIQENDERQQRFAETAEYERQLKDATVQHNLEQMRLEGMTEEAYAVAQAEQVLHNSKLELATIRERMAAKHSEQEQEQLRLEYAQKETEILQHQRELEKAHYAERAKYIEQEYQLGYVTAKEYADVVREGIRLQEIDPLEGLDKLQTLEGPVSAMVVGLRHAKMAAKSFNEEMLDFAETIGTKINSLVDNFVDAWYDGTKSTRELLQDFIRNVSRDFQKSFMRGLVNTILYGNSGAGTGPAGAGGGVFGFLTNGFGLAGGTGQPSPSATGTNPLGKPIGKANGRIAVGAKSSRATASDPAADATVAAMTDVSQSAAVSAAASENAAKVTEVNTQQMVSTIGTAALGIMGIASGTKEGLVSGIMMFTTSALQIFSMMAATSAASSATSSAGGIAGILGHAVGAVFAANGAVMSGGTISDFSNSIVTKPTTFLFDQKFANGGVGLMGEVPGKAEAILPLTQSSNGRYGVDARGVGGGAQNITINIMDSDGNTRESYNVTNNQGQPDFVASVKRSVQRDIGTTGTGINKALRRQGLRAPVMKNGG